LIDITLLVVAFLIAGATTFLALLILFAVLLHSDKRDRMAYRERRELYGRIQAYEIPEGQDDLSELSSEEDDDGGDLVAQESGGVFDPATKKKFHTKEEALAWREYLDRSGKPLDHEPDNALIGF